MENQPRRLAASLGALTIVAASIFSIAAAPGSRAKLPKYLSDTQIFRDLRTMTPNTSVIPYEVNVSAWSNGARTERWMILPGDGSSSNPTKDRIIVKPGLPWAFPTGSIFVQHFDWPRDDDPRASMRRLETRVLVRDKNGGVYGFTYKWNSEGTNASLVEQTEAEDLTVRRPDGSFERQRYEYPAPDQCLSCHNEAAGGVLGVNYRQINRLVEDSDGPLRNQVVAWNRAALLSKSLDEPKALDRWNLTWVPPSLPVPFWSVARGGRLVSPNDQASTVEDRARSYLDANCSSCHAPGIANADWDARSSTPLIQQGIVNGRLRVPRAGLTYIIKPGVPAESLLYLRLASLDPALKMPPVGRHTVDEAGLKLIKTWIESLPSQTEHP